ncbi:hypothetical protein [Mycobacteroides abscessus]
MKLEPTEAQRKAMAKALCDNSDCFSRESALDVMDDMFAAANSIPEGPPVGTIARRPDGRWVAHRCPAGWGYRRLRGDDKYPNINDADSWPVIFTPGEAVGSGPTTDGGETYDPTLEKTREEKIQDYMEWSETQIDTDALDPTAQQGPPKGLYGKYRVERVDGKPIRACFVLEYLDDLHANKALLEYAFSVERVNPELAKDLRTEWGKWPGRSQQEPGESLSRGLDDLAAGRVSRRDDYLEPQREPCCGVSEVYDCDCPPAIRITPKPRTPRVVDRLGVNEQGSRWRDVIGDVWNWDERGWHCVAKYGPTSPVPYLAGETALHGPFKEILEPRVLPSLDCDEARDGTVWTEKTGEWVYWFNESGWRTDSGILGGDYPLYQPRLLSIVGPYTEVLPDVG